MIQQDRAGQVGTLEDLYDSNPIVPIDARSFQENPVAPNQSWIEKNVISGASAFNFGVEHVPFNIEAASLGTAAVGAIGKGIVDATDYLGLPNDSLKGAILNRNWDALANPLLRNVGLDHTVRLEGFDPLTFNEGTRYEEAPQLFVGLNTPAEVMAKRALVDQLQLHSEDAAAHPAMSLLGAIGGDPSNYLFPSGIVGIGGKLASTVATGALAAGYFGAQSAIETQMMKSYDPGWQQDDVYTNAITGIMMGAILGSATGYLLSKSGKAFKANGFEVTKPTEVHTAPLTPTWDSPADVKANLESLGYRPDKGPAPDAQVQQFLNIKKPEYLKGVPDKVFKDMYNDLRTISDNSAAQLDNVKMKVEPNKVTFNPKDIGC